MIKTTLIDARNYDQVLPRLIETVKATPFIGLDCETHDDARHDGLNLFMKVDPVTRKKSPAKKLVFDMRRTVMTGFSIYPENDSHAYYLNLNHADVENRIPWDVAKEVLDAKAGDAFWIAHNAPYELSAFKSVYGYELPEIICTLQMAVSAYGPDEYNENNFKYAGRGAWAKLIPEMMQLCQQGGFDIEKADFTNTRLAELVYSIIGKQSKAAHSYNGYVNELAYGYGLKKAVKSWFGHNMTTFQEVLGDKAHMGQLTGEEVADYGADDAYWALRLFRRLLQYMVDTNRGVTQTFFNQENPMIHLFAQMREVGMKVNYENILARRAQEREEMAETLRKTKVSVRKLLPFSDDYHPGLMKRDSWYQKSADKYRKQVVQWAELPDNDNAYKQCLQVRGAVSNAWAKEEGDPEPKGVNLSHYMPMRTIFYDLTGTKVVVSQNKTQSDAEARGKLIDRFKEEDHETAKNLLVFMGEIASIEQRMKLYLTPYSQLTDPETGRMYPTVTSMLASRRMACEDPNAMQLAKRGESTYVRGFFEGDQDDHLVLSRDWSAVELVIIGELSQDPTFIEAYMQIPHQDLHVGSATAVLGADCEGLTETMFKSLSKHEKVETFLEEFGDKFGNHDRLFTNLKGEQLEPNKAYKYWRTEAGKNSNFNYWFSGWLATIGERMGWSQEKTKMATELYRDRFAVAEQWRVGIIEQLARTGEIHLPDGHRRVRWEATNQWTMAFKQKFDMGAGQELASYNALVHWIAKKIQKRAHNQGVNSVVQGTCATIAKRTALRVMARMKEMGWDFRIMRLMVPIHDELVFSIHYKHVVEGMHMLGECMNNHPDIFKSCKLDSSPAIGVTFEPFDAKKAPAGQIELYEAPKLPGVLPENTEGQRLNDDHVRAVVDYLMFHKRKIREAA
ncbi:DNA polymerase [Mesorhizobium sp. WSM2239]|uniref:DNA-directed DNA polymerase n=2 Tax=unclassified Mesorhizobium TaxID=325217 RepID=A0AAU8D108_9HYPH